MAFEQILIYILSFIVGLFISEVLSDFLLIKYEKGFKLRLNFGALNPFIKHDKALLMYFVEVILIGIFTYYLQKIFTIILTNNYTYYFPMFSLVITCLYILGIKKLEIRMNAKRWLMFMGLIILTAGLFFIVYWIKHPNMFENMKNISYNST